MKGLLSKRAQVVNLRTLSCRTLCLTSKTPYSVAQRHMSSNANLVQEGDAVYLKPRTSLALARDSIYIPRVEDGKRVVTHKGFIPQGDIIGRRVRDIVKSSKDGSDWKYEPVVGWSTGVEYLVTFPTLEEYIVYSARVVTPIYPADAAAIVNSLDLHVSPDLDPAFGPVEILEAGTGHGSLTLHLARAVHAGYAGKDQPSTIVHTVEKENHVAKTARKLLNGFRRGLYSGSGVQFYHSDVVSWLKQQISLRKQGRSAHEIISAAESGADGAGGVCFEETCTGTSSTEEAPFANEDCHSFLTACVLDMPDPRPVLPLLSKAMHAGGIVGYWAPSITQIVSTVQYIKLQRSPFYVEKVLEFASGDGGARVWDVRLAKVKSRVRATVTGSKVIPRSQGQGHGEGEGERVERDGELGRDVDDNFPGGQILGEDAKGNMSEWETVCRPKVGERVKGGGFYLVLRRIGQQGSTFEEAEASDVEAPNEDRLPPNAEKKEGNVTAAETI